ncbi:uncharacterized protein LOC112166469 isoform X5 [Rosa chinensis]|uniref:uncharacterized protein LOC112166469 isoform X5 n=1 Tax=Rosa chinensis TaxID=74649 RepID=UPI000D0867DF|nr:uncharacterized protein LOC112166469 isoform X5 [Rosa chinensis]
MLSALSSSLFSLTLLLLILAQTNPIIQAREGRVHHQGRLLGFGRNGHTLATTFSSSISRVSLASNITLFWLSVAEIAFYSNHEFEQWNENLCQGLDVFRSTVIKNQIVESMGCNQLSGNAGIHLDSLSIFKISGLREKYYHNSHLSSGGGTFVDRAVIAAARALPIWSDGGCASNSSMERRAIKELQEECRQMLAAFPTNFKEDQNILGKPATRILIYGEVVNCIRNSFLWYTLI